MAIGQRQECCSLIGNSLSAHTHNNAIDVESVFEWLNSITSRSFLVPFYRIFPTSNCSHGNPQQRGNNIISSSSSHGPPCEAHFKASSQSERTQVLEMDGRCRPAGSIRKPDNKGASHSSMLHQRARRIVRSVIFDVSQLTLCGAVRTDPCPYVSANSCRDRPRD